MAITPESPTVLLKDATLNDLLDELRRRGCLPSVWSAEDVSALIEEEDLTDEQRAEVGAEFFFTVSNEMEDILAERGNTYLGDRWSDIGDDIIARVKSPSPSV